ncbi:MAG TPA: aromatic acid/H+ symport family MFS transporter [Vicinamibacterales bacterium]|jgi:AAHS family 4-hydroxybenzoate transporter-like MFS transporter
MSAIVLFQVALCAMVTFTDGFDTQAIGYVAPAIVKAFGVERTALAPVFAVGLFGLMLGALAFGPIADRVGRKPVLVFCTAFFGLCALLTTQATTVNELFYFRFITGLGLGGALPNAIAITTDLAPARLRATTVMVMFCGFSIGAAVGGFMAASLLTRYGWPAVFVAGGIGPLVVALLLVGYLPNSRTHRPERLPVAQLFESGRSSMTILLWIVFFMSLLDLYFVTNWLPTLINDSGIALDRAVLVTAIFQLGGTVGTLTLGQLFDRLPPFRVLAATYLVAAALVAAIGLVAASIDALFIVAFGAGFCIVGGQTGANALTATVYPADIRATGVGWALGIGRIGSIVGPLVGGLLLTLKWETHDLFFVAAVPVLAAAASAFLIDRSPAYRRGENAVAVSTSH